MWLNICVYSYFSIQVHTVPHTRRKPLNYRCRNRKFLPFTLCHSGSDLALNQLAVLQAISRPPRRLYECSLNSRGPLGPLSTDPTWWVATAPVHTNRAVISRCANQRAVGVRSLCFLCCEASRLVHKGASPVWSGGFCSTWWPLWRSLAVSLVICAFCL